MSKGNQLRERTETDLKPLLCTQATPEQLKKQFYAHGPILGIKVLITHFGLHLDEVKGLVLVTETTEGKKHYPDIVAHELSLGFMTDLEIKSGGYHGEEGFFKAMAKGWLIIGTGNGPFDEHGNNRDKSCARIIAEYLGIVKGTQTAALFQRILNYTDYEDKNGNNFRELFKDPSMASTFDAALIANNMKQGVYAAQGDKEKLACVVEGVIRFIKNEIDAQKLTLIEGREAYRNARKQNYPLPLPKLDGRQLVAHVVYADHPGVSACAKITMKTHQFERIGVLIILNSKGQMYMCPMNGVELTEVVKILRVKIAQKRNMRVEWKELAKAESIESSPELYVHKNPTTGKIVNVFNGSSTQYDVPGLFGTVLNETDLLFALRKGLDSTYAKDFESGCKAGICAAKANGARCPLYHFGLQRCYNVRNTESNQGAKKSHVAAAAASTK